MPGAIGSPPFTEYDDAPISALQWKIVLVSGMGFFTDAYDLFIIGVVMAMLKTEWHPSSVATGLVTSTALLASAVGAIVFGRIADMLGRKRIYGVEVLVLAGGAIASALSPSIGWLIAFRIVLGVGIGGDYPVSATIMSEYAGKRARGMLVTMVFAMQAAGLVLGPLLAAAGLASRLPQDLVWRLLLAFGAIPALAVYYFRRQIDETPRYKEMMERALVTQPGAICAERDFLSAFSCLLSPRWRYRLLGASLAWFLMDFAYYGNTVSSPLVLATIAPQADLLTLVLTQLKVFLLAAVPGYVIAAIMMDRMGRKLIQTLGFIVMGITFGILALDPSIQREMVPFLLIYGASYLFTEFGPNATTFVYPSEIFPTGARTTGHGIAAAMGKLGAFIGVFFFPILLKEHGLSGAELAAAIVSVIGAAVTVPLLPNTKGKSLEELNEAATEPGGDASRRVAASAWQTEEA